MLKRTSTTKDDGEVKYFTITSSRHYKPKSKTYKIDDSKLERRTNCKAKLNAKQTVNERYKLSTIILEYNHVVSPSMTRHNACHKKLTSWSKKWIGLWTELEFIQLKLTKL